MTNLKEMLNYPWKNIRRIRCVVNLCIRNQLLILKSKLIIINHLMTYDATTAFKCWVGIQNLAYLSNNYTCVSIKCFPQTSHIRKKLDLPFHECGQTVTVCATLSVVWMICQVLTIHCLDIPWIFLSLCDDLIMRNFFFRLVNYLSVSVINHVVWPLRHCPSSTMRTNN